MRRIVLALVVLMLAACDEAAAPARQAAYAFDLYETGLVFRWEHDRLPVRYWVAPDAGLVADFAEEGLGVWGRQFLYGEYRGTIVSDPADADVLVYVMPATPPSGTPNNAPPAIGACDGVTSFDLTDDAVSGPFEITVGWDVRYSDQDVVNCLERVTVHEIGHTIGLFGHSGNELDLMHPNPRVRTPSPEDRVTAEVLYHTAPTVRPPGTQ
jgi:hypothetical protein